MTSHWRNLVLVLVALALTVDSLNAQFEPEDETRRTLPVSYEAIPFYSTDTSASIVRFHYRINQRFFVFVRNNDSESNFIAKGELIVELRNNQEVAIGREIRQIRLLRDVQPSEHEQLPDIQGSITFQVPEDEYTIIIGIDDKESGRKFIDRDKKVITRLPRFDLLELSNPMFATLRHGGPNESTSYIAPANIGTHVRFGSTGGFIYQVFLPEAALLNVRWRLQRQQGFLSDWFPTFAGDQYTLLRGRLAAVNQQEEVLYSIKDVANSDWKILYLPFPIEKLEPGGWSIDLEFTAGEEQTTKHYLFQVLWLDRPMTLLNSQLSIEALEHIATEDEISGMHSGSFARNVKAFYAFWKKRDPDTTTAYNEMMVEYYHRVDEANRRFSTLNDLDGYKTDRGRILILYGEPSRIEKFIPPAEAPSEIWVFDRLKRRFVFSDKYKNGNFVLIAAENL